MMRREVWGEGAGGGQSAVGLTRRYRVSKNSSMVQDCEFNKRRIGKERKIAKLARGGRDKWDEAMKEQGWFAKALDAEALRVITGKEYCAEEMGEIQEMVKMILMGKEWGVTSLGIKGAEHDAELWKLMKKYWVVVDAIFKLRTMAMRMKLFGKLETILDGITQEDVEYASFNIKTGAIKNLWSMIHDIQDNLINMQFNVVNIDNRKDITVLQQRAYRILAEKLGENKSVEEISAKLKELTDGASGANGVGETVDAEEVEDVAPNLR